MLIDKEFSKKSNIMKGFCTSKIHLNRSDPKISNEFSKFFEIMYKIPWLYFVNIIPMGHQPSEL